MKKIICSIVAILLGFSTTAMAKTDDFEEGKKLIFEGQLEQGAELLENYVTKNSRDKNKTPAALLLLGQTLDRFADLLSEQAEMQCYWQNKTGGFACMQQQAEQANKVFGKGAFKAITDIAYIPYTGIHYQLILKKFAKSDEAPLAEFQLLLKDLVGHPDQVLPKIKKFLTKHPSGEAHRKGLLLLARVNEDIWYIHRDWSWVLYNDVVATEELIIRAEPYRQEAIRVYQTLVSKYPKTFEGKMAKQELALVQNQKYDSETYSILSDSVGGAPEKWGTPIPAPKLKAKPKGNR
ncbi:MAG: hypothetical protein ABH859_06035 [Pseudomonadota bacterium]